MCAHFAAASNLKPIVHIHGQVLLQPQYPRNHAQCSTSTVAAQLRYSFELQQGCSPAQPHRSTQFYLQPYKETSLEISGTRSQYKVVPTHWHWSWGSAPLHTLQRPYLKEMISSWITMTLGGGEVYANRWALLFKNSAELLAFAIFWVICEHDKELLIIPVNQTAEMSFSCGFIHCQ